MELNKLTESNDFNHDVPNTPLAADTVLQDRYRIVRQLGRGGMGAVYEAVDQRLGITVALKETLSSEPSMRRQFEHEARLLAGMHHPALPRVSDHFVEGNRAFLVMQFIGGVDLARIISQQPGPFPREQVIAWADQLLDALVYLHSRDREVIHRDIKPHNLKLTSTGQIALLDFGLAKAQPSDASVTSSQAFFGYTRHYAPLEQIQDQRTDPRSDIYALGATLYHLLTGIKPPDALVRASALYSAQPDPLKPADKIHAAVGPQIAAILQKAMAQRPEDRYSNASEFREAFRRMGRANELASVIESDIDAGVIPRTIHAVDEPFDIDDTRTVVKSAVVQLAMVESARRFGPGAMTAVLLALVVLTGGVLYGSTEWFQSTTQLAAANSTTAVVEQRPTTTARRPERAAAAERARAGKSDSVVPSRTKVEKDVGRTEQNVAKRDVTATNSQASIRRSQPTLELKPASSRRRVNPPSIRLPNPEFRENTPARSTESRTYRMSSSVSPIVGPRFYRSADGTQIVKFSDGSTQFVRPVANSVRSGGSYR
ncbi:MAG: serine/threonine protein kinase [Pyrinomonadaceae bacterium]|nr:serine/threonine protein kinase [Pyrinomonadaceae bacterium]